MKIFLKRFLIYLIQKFSLNERLASLNKLVNYEINDPQVKEKVFGYFIDSFGSEHKLIEGLRDKIKPGWEGSLKKKNYENFCLILNQITDGNIFCEITDIMIKLTRINK